MTLLQARLPAGLALLLLLAGCGDKPAAATPPRQVQDKTVSPAGTATLSAALSPVAQPPPEATQPSPVAGNASHDLSADDKDASPKDHRPRAGRRQHKESHDKANKHHSRKRSTEESAT